MLLDYRCAACGEVSERIVSRDAIPPTAPCSCGADAARVFSTFAFKQYAVDRSTWSMVAPLNEDGRAMTIREAAKAGVVSRYRRGEQVDARNRQRAENEARSKRHMEEAKREAYRAQRIVVRS